MNVDRNYFKFFLTLLDNISKKNIDEIFYLGFKEVIGYNHIYNIEYKKVSNYYVFSIKLIELDMMKDINLIYEVYSPEKDEYKVISKPKQDTRYVTLIQALLHTTLTYLIDLEKLKQERGIK